MVDNYGYATAARSRQQVSDTMLESDITQSLPPTSGGLSTAYSIMGSGAANLGLNSSPYAGALQTMQGAYGNRALQRYLGSQGTSSASGVTQGSEASGGSEVSIQRFPNNPTPQIPSFDPELTSSWWGQGPTTWGGEIGGALDHESGTLPSGRPADARTGFGDIRFGSWQGANGVVHGVEGEGGLADVRLGNEGDTWLNAGLGTVSGGATWDRGANVGVEGSLLSVNGGAMGYDVVDAKLGSVEARGGVWDDGGWTTGVKGNISAGDATLFNNTPWLPGVELNGPSIGGELSVGNSGFTAGVGTNLIGGAMTFGDFTDGSDIESSTRFGLSVGDNVGARTHWGDEDGDGQREYGFGFDAGPVSFDYKTEDPLRSMVNTLGSAVMPMPLQIPLQAAGLMGFENPLLPEGNMTNAAWDTTKAAGNAMWDTVSSVDPSNFMGAAADAGTSAWDTASSVASSLW